jgi:hypothetical protein
MAEVDGRDLRVAHAHVVEHAVAEGERHRRHEVEVEPAGDSRAVDHQPTRVEVGRAQQVADERGAQDVVRAAGEAQRVAGLDDAQQLLLGLTWT